MSKTVITFGRMNPPTVGHQKVVEKVKAEAKKQGAMPHVYLSHSQDKKKNPLDYNTKIRIARKAFGPSVTKSRARTVIEVMQELEKMGHTEVTLIAGSDRVAEFKKLLNRYNGKDFTFDKITVKSAGERDPDAEGAEGMSATKMRAAAQSGDYNSFKKGTPKMSEKEKKDLYNKVRSSMESVQVEAVEYDDGDFEFTDEELDIFIDAIDLDSLDEEIAQDLEEEYQELSERKPLTVAQRIAIGRRMKRLAPRIKMARKRLAKRMADSNRLMRRSRKAALKIIRKRFAGKQGQNYANLSPSAKMGVDRIIQKKLPLIGKLAKRLMPRVRKAEIERLKRARMGPTPKKTARPPIKRVAKELGHTQNESFNESFENYLDIDVILEDEDNETNLKLMSMIRQAFRNPQERLLVVRALQGGEKSLKNPKLRPFILKLLNRLLDATQDDPSMFAKMRDKLRRMGQDDEKQVNEREDPDIGHRKGSQPAKYHSGLSKSTKQKRDAHFKKYADKDDDVDSNYKPAPGDKKAKTKPSVHTKKYKAMFGEDDPCWDSHKQVGMKKKGNRMVPNCVPKEDMDAAFANFIAEEYLEEKALEGLKKKSEKSGIPYGILKQVYNRGMAAWKTGHRPGTTPQQWAYARVNSFITGGKTRTTADKDLWAKAKGRKEEIEESYQGRIINLLKTKMIPAKFEDGKLIVDRSDLRAAHRAIKQFRDIKRVPSIVPGEVSEDAVKAAKDKISREKEADKRKHDSMLDRARLRKAQNKNRVTESLDDAFESLFLEEPRVPRKPGQPAGSDKHSDLYTDENPKDTIHGLKFATVKDAEASIKKIKSSGRKHAHKIQAAIAMEQRARVAGKKSAAAVYRSYINAMKKKTKQMRKEEYGAGDEGTDKLVKKYKKDTPNEDCTCFDHVISEAEYKGRKVTLNDPIRSSDGKKKFYVYVKNEKGNIVKVGFGDPNMEIKRDDPGRRKNFRARHNCDNPGPKWKARYWSCYQWRAGAKVDN
jgi:hypothetical protein